MTLGTKIYDSIDMRDNYNRGYWVGVVVSFCSTVVLLALIGLYLKT